MARTFDGVDDLIAATIAAVGGTDYTVGMWIKPNNAGSSSGILCSVENAIGGVNVFRWSGTTLNPRFAHAYSAGTTAASNASTNLTAGVWQCLIGTYTASDQKCRIYLGSLTGAMVELSYSSQTAGSGTPYTDATSVNIGDSSTRVQCMSGAIERLFILRRLYTFDEMERFRLGVMPVNTGSMKGFWPLDSPTASQAEDLSGSGATATVTEATASEGPPIPANWGIDAPILVERVYASIITATFAAPLGALIASITTTVEHPATFAAPLGGLSATATATPEHPAVLAAPLGGLSASITATPDHPATFDVPLGALTAEIGATVEHGATLDAPLGGLTVSIAATVEHPASFDAPLGALTASISVTVEHGAVLTADLSGLAAAIIATPEHVVLFDAPLGGLSGTIAAGVDRAAILDAPLGPLVAAIAADVVHPAMFSAPLGPLTATAPFVISHQAMLDAQLGGLVASAVAGVQHQALFTAPLGVLTATAVVTVFIGGINRDVVVIYERLTRRYSWQPLDCRYEIEGVERLRKVERLRR